MDKKWLFLMTAFFLVVMLSPSYAFEFDNVKKVIDTGEKYPEITIKNSFGIGKDLVHIKLVSNTEFCTDCEAVLKLDIYEDINIGSSYSNTWNWVFKDLKVDGNYKNLQHSFELADKNKTIDEFTGFDCSKVKYKPPYNVTDCDKTYVKMSVPDYTSFSWKNKEIKAGTYYLKLKGNKGLYDRVDWIATLIGVELDELAVWDTINPTAVWFDNRTTGIDEQNGTYNLIGSGSPAGGTGCVLNNACTRLVGGDYWYLPHNATFNLPNNDWTIYFWINWTQDLDNWDTIWDKSVADNNNPSILISKTTGQLQAYIQDGGGHSVIVSSAYAYDCFGEWCLIQFKRASNNVSIYWTRQTESAWNTTCKGSGAWTYASQSTNPLKIGQSNLGSRPTDSTLDQTVFDNKTAYSSSTMNDLFNGGSGSSILTRGAGGGSFNVTLNSPADNYATSSTTLDFNCSGADDVNNLVNLTLWIWNSSYDVFYQDTALISGSLNTSIWTSVGTFYDDIYTWDCEAGNDAPNTTFSPANRTFTIDTAPPTVNIITPTNIRYNNTNVSYSFTYSDSGTIDSCWYTLDSGSPVILPGCDNGTFIGSLYEASNTEYNNFTIWVNDTANNIGTDAIMFGIFNINSTSALAEVIETSRNNFRITLDSDYDFPGNDLQTYATTRLIINGTTNIGYLLSSTCVLGECTRTIYEANWTAPVNGTSDGNYSYFWNITFPDYVKGTFHLSESNWLSDMEYQHVVPMELYPCGYNSDNVTINISCWYEEDRTPKNCTLNYAIEYSKNLVEYQKVLNDTSASSHEHYICISPQDNNYYTDALIDFIAPGYEKRSYYLVNQSLSNTTYNLRLYHMNTSLNTLFTTTVYNEYYTPVADRYVSALRYYPELNSYVIVEKTKTNIFGNGLLHLYKDNPFYKFIVHDYTTLTKEVSPFKPTCAVVPCELLFVEQPTLTSLYSQTSGVTYNLSWNNNTETFRWFWSDTGGLTTGSQLKVYKKTGLKDISVCDLSSSAPSGTILCDVSGNGTGTYIGQGFILQSPAHISQTLSATIDYDYDSFKGNGEFWALIFLIVISIMGLALGSPIIGTILPIIGLFVLSMIGIIAILPGVLVGLLILALFIISRYRS